MLNVKILCNEDSKSQADNLSRKLIDSGFNIVDEQADLVFILGGDGTFLRNLRKLKYDDVPIYVGINNGNLGYLQDTSIDDIDKLIDCLKNNKNLKTNNISIAKITYFYNDNSIVEDYAINELQISGKHYHKIKFNLTDCIDFKEEIEASGIVFATPTGSTAYSKSLGGAVICEGVDAMCATLLAPIQNSKTKDYIQNSLIGKRFSFKLLSDSNDIEIIIDGQNINVDIGNINYIKVEIGFKNIHKLNYSGKSYSANMFEKMLKK